MGYRPGEGGAANGADSVKVSLVSKLPDYQTVADRVLHDEYVSLN